jgi:hypothetical protein
MAHDLTQLSDAKLAQLHKRAREDAWRKGELRWLLRPCQQEVYDEIKVTWERGDLYHVLEIARRFGKSTIMLVLALECGFTINNASIHYAAPTMKMVRRILVPNMRVLLAKDCPKDIRPIWNKADGIWTFPSTGAELLMSGCEDEQKADGLRGTKSNLFLGDECGFIDVLNYVITSIALPQTRSNPETLPDGGKMLLGSTPAISPGHDFTGLCVRAEADGRHTKRRARDSSAATEENLAEWIKEAGGEDSPAWRREGEVERVVDASRAIIVEFSQYQSQIVREVERPQYFDTYTTFDIGWTRDLTFAGFGYWHFPDAVLVVEDELVIEPGRMASDVLAEGIREKEQALWGADWARWEAERHQIETLLGGPAAKPVHLRHGDDDKAVLHELNVTHKLPVFATEKHDKESAINAVKLLARQGKLAIHPRCKQLVSHLLAGIWNKQHTSFERMEGFGHFDGVDMLIYKARNINRTHNPYPETPPVSTSTHHVGIRARKVMERRNTGLIKAFGG